MKTKIIKKRYLLPFALAIMSLSCGNDDSEPVVPVEETQLPDTSENAACKTVSLFTKSVFPVDKILINGISDDFGNDITAEFWYEGEFLELSMNVGTDKEGKSFILAPIHPAFPIKGGDMKVVLKGGNGTTVCDPLTFTIKELPEAKGYTKEVVLAFDALLKQSIDYLGIDRAILAGNLENLDPSHFPFAFIYNLLHNESSEFALLPFIENNQVLDENSMDKETSMDLVDRILKKYDLLDLINTKIDEFEEATTAKDPTVFLIDPIDCENIDEDILALQMSRVWETFNLSLEDQDKLTELTTAASLAGLVPPFSTTAGVIGFMVFAYQKLGEGYQNTRLSKFEDFDFSIDPDEFIEEAACDPVPYDNVQVWASSNGWELDSTLWESLYQIPNFLNNVSTLNLVPDSGLKGLLWNVTKVLSGNQLQNLVDQGYFDGDHFKIDAVICGPIAITSSQYIYSKINSDSFTVDQENMRVVPQKAGVGELEVGLKIEEFRGVTISKTKELTINPVVLKWMPEVEVLTITPGEDISLDVLLENALNKELTVSTEEGAIQYVGFKDEGVPFGGTQQYALKTPSLASIEKYPFTVTAEFASQECLRGNEHAEPVRAIIIIDAIKPRFIEVYSLELGCFKPGDVRDFDVNLSDDNMEVIWTAKHEDGGTANITQDGEFTAPQKLGKYYITATAVSYSEVYHTLEVEINKCICFWNFSGGIFNLAYDQAWYSIQGDMSNGVVQIDLHNDFYNVEDESFTIGIDTSLLPEDGQTKVTNGTNTDDLTTNLINITGLNLPDVVGGPLGSYSVTLKRNSTYLEGTISGTMVNATDDSEFEFILEFGANEGLLSCE